MYSFEKNSDEENKFDRANIIQLIKECSDENDQNNSQFNKTTDVFTNENYSKNHIDFIKSIGWMKEHDKGTYQGKYGKKDAEYQSKYYKNKASWQNSKQSWSSSNQYYKTNYYDKYPNKR